MIKMLENASAVYKYLLCITNDGNIAEELLQETFYQATKTIDKFRGDCKVTVWLCQIAKRLWYKELKKRGKKTVSFDEMEDEIEGKNDIENYWIHNDVIELYKQLHKLDEKTREVMYLRLSFWLRKTALPIVCIWILILWLYVWGFRKLKIEVAFKVSIGSLIAMFGAIGTNYIVQRNSLESIISANWINILCLSAIGIISLGIGLISGKKKFKYEKR